MKPLLLLLNLLFLADIAYSQQNTFHVNQRASYHCTSILTLDPPKTSSTSNEVFFLFDSESTSSQLKSRGLRVVGYPRGNIMGYLINSSDSTFKAIRDGRSLILIQEALDEKGNWEPIEYWIPAWCGNSFDNPLILEPGEYVMVLIKKYSGSFKTRIRLKFYYGPEVFYSDSFEGSINKAQFKKLIDGADGPVSYLNEK